MGAFTEMVTLFLLILILTSLNKKVEKGVLSATFCLPKSP